MIDLCAFYLLNVILNSLLVAGDEFIQQVLHDTGQLADANVPSVPDKEHRLSAFLPTQSHDRAAFLYIHVALFSHPSGIQPHVAWQLSCAVVPSTPDAAHLCFGFSEIQSHVCQILFLYHVELSSHPSLVGEATGEVVGVVGDFVVGLEVGRNVGSSVGAVGDDIGDTVGDDVP